MPKAMLYISVDVILPAGQWHSHVLRMCFLGLKQHQHVLQVFGGEDGKSRIFRSTMTHNRKQCIAFYLEEEYEQLVLECYWTARARVKGPNNRYRFSCIHCKESEYYVLPQDVQTL
jgi:hypothetical protein